MYRMFTPAIICFVLMLGAVSAHSEAEATAGSVSTKLDVAYVSKYVWRGLVPNPDSSLQPSLTFAHDGGVSLNIWGSADLTDVNDERSRLTEIDYTLDFATRLAGKGLNVGLIHYTFPNTSFDSTSECYAAMGFDGKIPTTISANYDFDEARGCYISVNGSYACNTPWQRGSEPGMNLSARMSYATRGYNGFYFGVDRSAFTDLLLSASVPLKLAGKISLVPSISYSRILDGGLRDSVAAPDNFWMGLTASMSL